ncbi:NAD(P)-dependent oxidoreductase [Conexibacter sp. DBS9H8]|uniref:NAD-dependent epimerase/dehydratase family protein n=1 Tax=Conexibacter sp. DBS9H8 TaxID=2937801 RepID=UPI00200E83BA|nr:NAD-dependent epimerase/dehydratase family protein [Conexibacter sp. DBS9H8]
MILLTGGHGFIGSHIRDVLLEAGHEVRILDLRPHTGDAESSVDGGAGRDGVDVRVGDLRDREVTAAALAGVDAVCHQAAMVGLGVDLGDMPDYVSHNDGGTAVLLTEMARRRFRGRLVLASSMVVYGEGRYRCPACGPQAAPPRTREDLAGGRFDVPCPACARPLEPEAVSEDAPADPRNVYAATKLHQEHLAFTFARETGVPVTALRYHNVYGPRMPANTPYAGVASLFASALERGEAPRVFEDGRQLRDFIHVRDVARANRIALTAPEPVPGPFNVATGDPHSVLELAQALAATRPDGPRPEVTGEFRLGDVRHVFASADRARTRLGFSAEVSLAEGMAQFARAAGAGTTGPVRTGPSAPPSTGAAR